jgi:SAM-dependent methyltransferase
MTDAWEGERVARWIAAASSLEPQLAPVSDALFEVAALQPGDRVLDIGCGTGPTTHRAAGLVGPTGAVTGLDVSAEMLDAARTSAVADGTAAAIDWVATDATHWPGPAEPFDVVISRFGVMFFDDPAAAFANLAALTRPGGRLVVAVWAHRRDNPLFEIPLAAALAVRDGFGLSPAEIPSAYLGAFSLAEPDHIRDLLSGAGWSDIDVDERRLRLPLAGGRPLDDAARSTLEVGPTRVVTDDMDPSQKAAAVVAIAEALLSHQVGSAVLLDASVHIVTASRTSEVRPGADARRG